VAAFGKVGSTTVIEVRDQGIGIPENLRDKVFERFYRADNSRNRETGGSGLGLSIVKAIVERHGGKIVALETPGGGATIRVELP
jgi:two-component system OmpR family sensor kinase